MVLLSGTGCKSWVRKGEKERFKGKLQKNLSLFTVFFFVVVLSYATFTWKMFWILFLLVRN